jgi:hypothetical protein
MPAKPRRQHIVYEELGSLLKRKLPRNAKKHDEALIKELVDEYGYVQPVLVDDKSGVLAAGHGRIKELERRRTAGEAVPEGIEVRGGKWFVPVTRGVEFKSKEQVRKYAIADNRSVERGGWDDDLVIKNLTEFDSLVGTGYEDADLVAFLANADGGGGAGAGKLSEQFLVPPFSVLDARQGYWQERKRAWLSLGIQSELGRGGAPGGSIRPQVKGGKVVHEPLVGAGSRANATPGGAMMPAANYGKTHARGDGRGRAVGGA